MISPNFNKISYLIRILGVIIILGSLLISGCNSSSAANDKKAKAKKSKAIETEEEEPASNEEPAQADEAHDKTKANTNVKASSNVKNSNTSETDKKSDNSDKKSSQEELSKAADKKPVEKEKTVSADEVWADLMRGNKRFISGKHTSPNYISMRKGLVAGQHPQVIVLGCADSRVPPELLFDKNLGEIFVVRDAGNIADEVTLGSIEYAIEHLHAKVVIILGHESCGAVAAAVSGEKMPTRNLQSIVDRISPAFEDSKDCPIGGKINLACVELNVMQSANDLLMQSSIIKKASKEDLTIIKAVYHLDTGEVVRLK